jgi:hypothetical protein
VGAHSGAEPLEDLICATPELFVERTEELALHDPAFRQALGSAWITLEEFRIPSRAVSSTRRERS